MFSPTDDAYYPRDFYLHTLSPADMSQDPSAAPFTCWPLLPFSPVAEDGLPAKQGSQDDLGVSWHAVAVGPVVSAHPGTVHTTLCWSEHTFPDLSCVFLSLLT